jgi:AcrR family transcriptional regulator
MNHSSSSRLFLVSTEPRKRGRQAEAERNNVRILEAAREVFIANPTAPISEVASRAGVGIAALYHRYPSKNALLAQLCLDGQDVYIELVEKALASPDDPWTAYVQWLRDIVAADTHALTVHLAGHFIPDERHVVRTEQMIMGTVALFERVQQTGALRRGLTFLDVAFLLELLAKTKLGDAARTAELRQRQLAIIIDGLSVRQAAELPGTPPSWQEQASRWTPASDGPSKGHKVE